MYQTNKNAVSEPNEDALRSELVELFGTLSDRTEVFEKDTIVYNENELKDLILDAVRAAEKEVKFVIIGGWLTDELLYDIVFSRIHNVYMLDAFGLYSYSTTVTTSGSKGIYLWSSAISTTARRKTFLSFVP